MQSLCYIIWEKVSMMAELKLLGTVELGDKATPEERAGLKAVLERAGLIVFENDNQLYIRVEDR